MRAMVTMAHVVGTAWDIDGARDVDPRHLRLVQQDEVSHLDHVQIEAGLTMLCLRWECLGQRRGLCMRTTVCLAPTDNLHYVLF
jgi:hypothetical protein